MENLSEEIQSLKNQVNEMQKLLGIIVNPSELKDFKVYPTKRFYLVFNDKITHSDHCGTWIENNFVPFFKDESEIICGSVIKKKVCCEFDTLKEAVEFAKSNQFEKRIYIQDSLNNTVVRPNKAKI